MSEVVTFPKHFKPHVVPTAPNAGQRLTLGLADAIGATGAASLDLSEAMRLAALGRPLGPGNNVDCGETLTSLLSATLAVIDIMGAPEHTRPLRHQVVAWLSTEGGGDDDGA
ncbi:hypothetical protein HGO38_01360 [Rhizobium sp. CG5]|uniref:hypothetical protein n=1 Tax=Rhizobium sp. CG5 TaxID=2726076 RepID=UPI002033FA93|nr:hypothetical protein [Rhizobium sp. CG5]MCM2472123.1 hypothetical protein [Rhizobium sp. CG5]